MVNVPLLQETLEHIKNNPQSWYQNAWFSWVDSSGEVHTYNHFIKIEEINSCGSAFCFAGHAALKEGFPNPPKPTEVSSVYAPWVNEDGVEVMDFARGKLGLSFGQASILFGAGNSLEDLEKIVDAIIADPDINEDELVEKIWPAPVVDDDEDDVF